MASKRKQATGESALSPPTDEAKKRRKPSDEPGDDSDDAHKEEEPSPDGEGESGGESNGVLEAMRRQESAVIDTRMNFAYGLPKKARMPKDLKEWQSVRDRQGKLTNYYAQIDMASVKIEGPLTLVDFQPVRADSNNFRFLTPDELAAKLPILPKHILLGSPPALPPNPELVPKKNSANSEWIAWLEDQKGRKYPMTEAAWAHLYRTKRIPPIQIQSDSGWRLCSDQDRVFVIPNDFIPSISTPDGPNPNSASEPSALDKPTPAVALSNAAKTLLTN